MTRFARMQKKKHLEATSWGELAGKGSGKERVEQDNGRTDQTHDNEEKNTKIESRNLKRKESDTYNGVESSCTLKKPKVSNGIETEYEISSKNSEINKQKRHAGKGKEEKSQGGGKLGHKSHEMIRQTDKTRTSSSATKHKSTGSQRNREKLEKRREARRKRREKRKVCLYCRKTGHKVSECPQSEVDRSGVGTCYKCGSTEHTTKNCSKTVGGDNSFPFAKCFVCGDMGHLARKCPENPRGLYPRGGGCKICGSVEHLKRDCSEKVQNKTKGSKEEYAHVSSSLGQRGHLSADAELERTQAKTDITKTKKKGPRVVQF